MNTEMRALINLMQDDDLDVALIAMEKLLTIPEFVEQELPELQESSEAKIRERVHQMESILWRKNDLTFFIERIRAGKINLWQDLLHLNRLVDPRFNSVEIEEEMTALKEKVELEELNAMTLAAFMNKAGFSNSVEEPLDEMLFLLVDIFENFIADSMIASVIAREIGRAFSWEGEIVLHKGHHCLLDKKQFFIDPDNSWKTEKMEEGEAFYTCSDKDILLSTLTRLYLAALNDGQLKVIHSLSKVMAELCDSSLDSFPYPVGQAKPGETPWNPDSTT